MSETEAQTTEQLAAALFDAKERCQAIERCNEPAVYEEKKALFVELSVARHQAILAQRALDHFMSPSNKDLLKAAKDALLALDLIGFPMSDAAWQNTGDNAPASSMTSEEYRLMHLAAVKLANAIKKVDAP